MTTLTTTQRQNAEKLYAAAIEELSKEDIAGALSTCKAFYFDQSPAARVVLTEDSWLYEAFIVEFLTEKFPSILPALKAYVLKVEKKADLNWFDQVGQHINGSFENNVEINVTDPLFITAENLIYTIGENLIHQRFGSGILISEDEEKVIVNFKDFGKKELLKKYAKLEKA